LPPATVGPSPERGPFFELKRDNCHFL